MKANFNNDSPNLGDYGSFSQDALRFRRAAAINKQRLKLAPRFGRK